MKRDITKTNRDSAPSRNKSMSDPRELNCPHSPVMCDGGAHMTIVLHLFMHLDQTGCERAVDDEQSASDGRWGPL